MQLSFERVLANASRKLTWENMPVYHKDDDHEVRLVEIDDMVVTRVSGKGGWNAHETFKKLPDSMCQASHYGIVLKGRVNVVTKDGPIECVEGDAYYQAVPHRVEWIEDSILLEFSPSSEFWNTEVMMKS